MLKWTKFSVKKLNIENILENEKNILEKSGNALSYKYKSTPYHTIQIIFIFVCSTDNEYWIGAKYGTSDWVWENGMDITETFPTVRDLLCDVITEL